MPMYSFNCPKCEEETTVWCSFENLPKKVACEHCLHPKCDRKYGFGMIRSYYEQNGRKAVAVNIGGKTVRRSMTRENYERTGKSESVYTKGYQEHLKKNVKEKKP